jgi:hypothetical protein
MNKVKVAVIVGVCVLLVAAAAGVAISTSYKKKKERRRIQTACAASESAQTTFVVLVSLDNPKGAAATIQSLFERAHCPLRVYVGLVEIYGPHSQTTTLEEYEAGVRFSKAPFCLKDHVRVLKIPLSEHRGVVSAYEHAERYLYKNETFVVTMQPHTDLVPQWELLCISALSQQEKLNRTRHQPMVLTTVLATEPGSGAQPDPKVPGTYCAFTPRGKLVAYPLKKLLPAVPTLPAVAWSSSFSFTTGVRVAAVPYNAVPDGKPTGLDMAAHDMYMTLKLQNYKWQLLHPAFTVGVVRKGLPANAQGSSVWYQQLLKAAGGTGSGWFKVVDGLLPRVSARAQLGLSPTPSTDEVNAKLGSMGELYSMLSRLELHAANP